MERVGGESVERRGGTSLVSSCMCSQVTCTFSVRHVVQEHAVHEQLDRLPTIASTIVVTLFVSNP